MLHINDLTYRIEGRLLFEKATAGLPERKRIGLVGRNGTGKSTLFRLIMGDISPDEGGIQMPNRARIGGVAQEAPGGQETLLEWVLMADKERAALLAEAEEATDPNRIAEIHLRLTDIDAHSAPARAGRILAGLGFDEVTQNEPCGALSGGWRMRVALAAALFEGPDILLLDEPTNYLDFEGAAWLESFLQAYPGTVLVASHDRELLNNAVTHILHLSNMKLTLYTGGYDQFEEARREKQRLDLKLIKKQDEHRRHLEAFVSRFRYKATKARQAQSRIKMLEKMQPIAAEIDGRVAPFHLPGPEKALGDPLIRLEGAAAGYTADTPVLSGLDLRIDCDDRIGLLGANGNGKSTFAKLLVGALEPMAGRLQSSKKLVVGYFAQHQLDELNPQGSAYDHFAPLLEDKTEAQKRAKLGQYGFTARIVDTAAKNLSGGEKARLLFALATFCEPHILILDEPTNHLDVDSREALIHALNDYEGAVILISHDRHLLETCADRLWIVRDGSVSPFDGDVAAYSAECLAERGVKTKEKSAGGGSKANRKQERKEKAAARAQLAPMRKALNAMEKNIQKITKDIAALDTKLGDTELYERDPDKALALQKKRGELTRSLADAEEEWLSASEELEAADA